jgi:hypothetical protein
MHLFISSFFGKKEERNEELNEKELLNRKITKSTQTKNL